MLKFQRDASMALLQCSMIAALIATGTALNMNNLCQLVPTNTLVAASEDCNATYYFCSGVGAVKQTCASGYIFNKDVQSCLPASQESCGNPCKAAKSLPAWVPASGSCSGFFYCNATGAYRGACPHGEVFNAQTQTCNYNNGVACTISDVQTTLNVCSYIPSNIYFGSTSTCAEWFICNNGLLTSGNCPAGFVLNVNSQVCDFPANTPCTQVTYDPELTMSSTNNACSAKGDSKAGPACTNYYKCNGKVFLLETCPGSLFYDTVSKTCVSHMDARNDCNRCVGTHDTFVNAYSQSNCTGYLYCVDGLPKSKGTCAVGFFDEIAGGCTDSAEPNFGCCNPKFYDTTTTPKTTTADTASTASLGETEASASTLAEKATKATESATAAEAATTTETIANSEANVSSIAGATTKAATTTEPPASTESPNNVSTVTKASAP